MPRTLVRVVHLNAHRFASLSGNGISTVDRVAVALRELRPDILTLNEVDIKLQPDCLQYLGSQLSVPHVEFFGHVRGFYGNAILSRFPLRRCTSICLEGGTVFNFPAGTKKFNGDIAQKGESHRIVRGFLLSEVFLPGGRRLLLGVTHLDHMDVAQRQVQLRHIVREMALSESTKRGSLAEMLVGDLNALTRCDYSNEAWESLKSRAKCRGWQLPQCGDLDILASAGFEDAGINSGRQLTAPVPSPLYRIDYGWLRGPIEGTAWVANNVAVSDHFPLVIDVKIEGPPQSKF